MQLPFCSCIWDLFPTQLSFAPSMSSLFPTTSWVHMASLKLPHLDHSFQRLLSCCHSLLPVDLMAILTSPVKHLYHLQTIEAFLARGSEKGFNGGSGAFKIVGGAAEEVCRPPGMLPWLFQPLVVSAFSRPHYSFTQHLWSKGHSSC